MRSRLCEFVNFFNEAGILISPPLSTSLLRFCLLETSRLWLWTLSGMNSDINLYLELDWLIFIESPFPFYHRLTKFQRSLKVSWFSLSKEQVSLRRDGKKNGLLVNISWKCDPLIKLVLAVISIDISFEQEQKVEWLIKKNFSTEKTSAKVFLHITR